MCSPLILGGIKFATIFPFLMNKSCGSFDSRDEWKLIMDNSVWLYSRWSPRAIGHRYYAAFGNKYVQMFIHFADTYVNASIQTKKKKFCALFRQAVQPHKALHNIYCVLHTYVLYNGTEGNSRTEVPAIGDHCYTSVICQFYVLLWNMVRAPISNHNDLSTFNGCLYSWAQRQITKPSSNRNNFLRWFPSCHSRAGAFNYPDRDNVLPLLCSTTTQPNHVRPQSAASPELHSGAQAHHVSISAISLFLLTRSVFFSSIFYCT